jgi:hypothetical protein
MTKGCSLTGLNIRLQISEGVTLRFHTVGQQLLNFRKYLFVRFEHLSPDLLLFAVLLLILLGRRSLLFVELLVVFPLELSLIFLYLLLVFAGLQIVLVQLELLLVLLRFVVNLNHLRLARLEVYVRLLEFLLRPLRFVIYL